MQFHTLKSKTARTRSRQVGRGGTRGKTAGRGTKGQNARAGRKKRPELRDTIKRFPKLRGRGNSVNTSIQIKPLAVNLKDLETAFSAGEVVSRASILEKGLVSMNKTGSVKVLGTGDLTKKLNVEGLAVSKVAREKIEALGGKIS